MDLRDYARTETAAFVDRLVGAAEALAQSARTEGEAQVAAVRAELEALRDEFQAQATRATALEADLDAVIEAHRQVDADRLAAEKERAQEAAARTKADEELRGARELLERTRAEATRVSEALEQESAQTAILQEELAGVRAEAAKVAAARTAAEEKSQQLQAALADADTAAQALRERFHEELRAARAEAEAISADRDTLRAEAGSLRAEIDTLRADAKTLKGETDTLRAEADGLRAELATAHAETATARADAATARAEAATLRAEAATLRAETATLRAEGSGTAGELQSLQEMLDASRVHHEQHVKTIRALEARLQNADGAVTSTLAASVRAFEALGATTTIAELFSALVRQLATEMPRVALFRLKGNHLEGDEAAGFEDSTQIKKLVIPMNLDSVITRAVSEGRLVRADGSELAQTRPPVGGAPASALAVPLVFQEETLAVLYADSNTPASEAHSTFALLLVRHATVLLSRLTQELKLLKELRDYASMLLQEAEQMFVADVEAARPAHESIRRLRDTIDCGRQLYAQRAALEGTSAAGIFDEQIGLVINAQGSAFAEALAAATQSHDAQRNAS